MKKIDPKDLLKAGLHFGHRPTAWHPKMEPYIFGTKNTVHVFDLEKTKEKLEESYKFIQQIAAKGGTILFVGTRPQAKEIIKKYALECEMPYVTERWLGGTLTNFKVINGLVKKLEELINQTKDENYEKKYTKKERHEFAIEMRKLEIMVGGISNMHKIPEAIFISSVRDEKTALREAVRKKIPIVGVCDTNANPTGVDYVVPANDDAVKAIEFVAALIADAVREGRTKKDNIDVKETRNKKQETRNNQ